MLLLWEDREEELKAQLKVSSTKGEGVFEESSGIQPEVVVENKDGISQQSHALKCDQLTIALTQAEEQVSLKDAKISSLQIQLVVTEEHFVVERQRKEQFVKAAIENIDQLQVLIIR